MCSMRKFVAAVLVLTLLFPVLPASAAERKGDAFGTLWQHFSGLEAQWLRQFKVYDTPPQYFQTDYPDTPYGHGTVSTSGCGIVCLSMAATYLKDRRITPDQLAAQFGSLQMNNVQRIDHAIEVLDLPFAFKPRNWGQMMTALRNGQLVILLVNDKSDFTSGQHMLLLTGLTEDGRVLVNDPYEPNYNRADLITGYTYGFLEEILSKGFDGGWIFGEKQENEPPAYTSLFRNFRFMDWITE